MADEMSGDQKTVIKPGGPSQYVKLNVGGHLFYVSSSPLFGIICYCQMVRPNTNKSFHFM